MTSSRMTTILAALALAAVLTGCKERKDPGFQGWVEADMIFVSPDESGRVTKLNARGRRGQARHPSIRSTTICSRRTSTSTRRRSPTRSRPSIARRR